MTPTRRPTFSRQVIGGDGGFSYLLASGGGPANNPTPAITSLSPTNANAGSIAFTLTVNGTGFISTSVVNWNGAARTTTFVSATQLQAAITAPDVATASTPSVTVFSPTPGGGTSNAATFTVNALNPVPTIASLVPSSATAGASAFTLTVNGTGYVSTSVVNWNGVARTTTFVSATQIQAAILVGDIAASGTGSVTVFNPTPGGGTSSAATFTIIPLLNFDFTTGSLPGAITFTRASIGTYNSSGNILTTASSNVARFNYVSGVANLLIEPSATNLITQSNNFVLSGPWFGGGGTTVTATAAQFISPDGANNGWAMASTPAGGYFYDGNVTYSNIPYTQSIWAKQITAGIDLQFSLSAIASGAIGITTTLARRSFTATPPAASNNYLFMIVSAAGSMGAYGAQLEAGPVATSYIPTGASTVTRAADSAVFTIPAGIGHLTYTFDDNTTQLVTVSAGSYTIPTTLNRSNIKSIVGSA